jgi:pentatricopeptide repeat protein
MITSMCKAGDSKTLAFGLIEKMMSQELKAIDICLEGKLYPHLFLFSKLK